MCHDGIPRFTSPLFSPFPPSLCPSDVSPPETSVVFSPFPTRFVYRSRFLFPSCFRDSVLTLASGWFSSFSSEVQVSLPSPTAPRPLDSLTYPPHYPEHKISFIRPTTLLIRRTPSPVHHRPNPLVVLDLGFPPVGTTTSSHPPPLTPDVPVVLQPITCK